MIDQNKIKSNRETFLDWLDRKVQEAKAKSPDYEPPYRGYRPSVFIIPDSSGFQQAYTSEGSPIVPLLWTKAVDDCNEQPYVIMKVFCRFVQNEDHMWDCIAKEGTFIPR